MNISYSSIVKKFDKKEKLIKYFFLIAIFACTACQSGNNETKKLEQKELLIYCGITMIKPMTEIKEIIEVQENCKIVITKGGSGNLLKAIIHNKNGDLFLPGSDAYYTKIEKESPGIIDDTVFVGYNKAAIMIQKDNPLNISNDLSNLTDKKYSVVIGNPESGSIGKETKKILDRKGIFEQVENNALKLTTDSKDLVRVLIENEADIVINWFATSTWDENKNYIDVLPIEKQFAKKKKLVIGLLKTSEYPEIAKKFMLFAASEQGKEIFRKYGLYNVK
ncbi:MAG: molybdate ABC transporter substrate-binding protein [Bacteroidetes bacterium]|jgi:molybdate transport system substrate-binding protein|nr:molybdate ABC transporter substrate-binding protein [Bacteroidota bacterium]MBT6684937.1 molybdate ABC transporter substrate-binding protein [Bacteroidota bacterium]MBT7145242.1 molybdate ABC transporter substrate-binding protein [Bacteroidota bacterium]MBT7493013.1 molybdate ABC transporter substrate-binding protein [Bacteroidota bacterium]